MPKLWSVKTYSFRANQYYRFIVIADTEEEAKAKAIACTMASDASAELAVRIDYELNNEGIVEV